MKPQESSASETEPIGDGITATACVLDTTDRAPQAVPPDIFRRRTLRLIDDLAPYATQWRIEALLTRKSDIRTNGEQKHMFTATFRDMSGCINVVVFDDCAAELHWRLVVKRVYSICDASVQRSNHSTRHFCELVIKNTSYIHEAS